MSYPKIFGLFFLFLFVFSIIITSLPFFENHSNGSPPDRPFFASSALEQGELLRLHSNKRFFRAEKSMQSFGALNELFSSIEISLECDPKNSSAEFSEQAAFLEEKPQWHEGFLECDGVSLSNEFKPGGQTPSKVKQLFLVTNHTSQPQKRLIGIRLKPKSNNLKYARENVGEYELILSDSIEMLDESNKRVGFYDWSDFVKAGFAPHTYVYVSNGQTVIETILEAELFPMQTLELDPTYDLSDTGNFKVGFFGGNAGDKLGLSFSRVSSTFLVNIDGGAYTNDLLVTSYQHDTNGNSNSGAIYLIKNINSLSGLKDLNSSANYDVAWIGGSANDNVGFTNIGGLPLQVVNVDNGSYSNDILISAPNVDVNGKTDAGAVYLIKNVDSLSGTKDLNIASNFDVRWEGGAASDQLSYTNHSDNGARLLNLDNGAYANDLLMMAVNADVNGKSNNGGVYVVRNIDSLSGTKDLNSTADFNASWNGGSASDNLGYAADSGNFGLDVVNIDNGAYANDMFIVARNADINSKTDNGAVYMVKNIDSISGARDLSSVSNYDVLWNGGTGTSGNGDQLGFTNDGGPGLHIINVDNGAYSNDIFLLAVTADINSKSNAGAVYLVKNVDSLSGARDLSSLSNFDVRWNGGSASDQLGFTDDGNASLQLVNVDNGAYANDLLLTATAADINSKSDAGAVYLVKNVDSLSGAKDLSSLSNFDVRWNGGSASDELGTADSRESVVLFGNMDGGAYTNDLVLGASKADVNGKTDGGAVYLVKNVDSLSGAKDLNVVSNFDVRWEGGKASDLLGDAEGSGPGIQLVSSDGEAYSNDLLLTAVYADINGVLNTGAVYLINDINLLSGTKDLNVVSDFNVRWGGGSSSDEIGLTINRDTDLRLVSVDGGAYSNDLLIPAPIANISGKTDPGAVYLIRNVDLLSGEKNLGNTSSFDVRWNGAVASDQLGISSQSGPATRLVNADGQSYANDLLFVTPNADVNTISNNGAVYLVLNIVPVPDVNITAIDGNPDSAGLPFFSYAVDGNLTIDFNVMDADSNNLRVDLNYSSSSSPYTGTAIVSGLDLNTLSASGPFNCQDTNFADSTQCSVDWNISGISDGNYYLHITVSDGVSVDQNTSDVSVGIDNSGPSVSITSTNVSQSTGYGLSYSGSDSQSGVKNYWVREGSGDWIDNGTNTSYSFSISPAERLPAYHSYGVKVTNNADANSDEATIQVRFESASGGGWSPPSPDANIIDEDSNTIGSGEQDVSKEVEREIAFSFEQRLSVPASAYVPLVVQTPLELEKTGRRLALQEEVGVTRKLKIFSELVEGKVFYNHEFELSVKNTSGRTLKNVKVMESIPKKIAQNAGLVESSREFEVLKEDPVIEFFAGSISAGKSVNVNYNIAEKKKNPISKSSFESIGPAVVTIELSEGDVCLGVLCDDENPCTNDYCVKGECKFSPSNEGKTCADNKVCAAGQCVKSQSVAVGSEEQKIGSKSPDLPVYLAIGVLVVLLIAGASMLVYKKLAAAKKQSKSFSHRK